MKHDCNRYVSGISMAYRINQGLSADPVQLLFSRGTQRPGASFANEVQIGPSLRREGNEGRLTGPCNEWSRMIAKEEANC